MVKEDWDYMCERCNSSLVAQGNQLIICKTCEPVINVYMERAKDGKIIRLSSNPIKSYAEHNIQK